MLLPLLAVFVLIQNIRSNLLDLTCEQVKQFVDGHNNLRMMLANGTVSGQPPAEKMNMITWDYELANKSATWASRDNYGHNPDTSVPSGRFITGENIFYIGSTSPDIALDIDHVLSVWCDERKDFYFHALTSSDIPVVGHYTQMAWSNSTYVGCGVSKYWNGYHYYFVVCNYGPAGNWQGQTPYEAGSPSDHLVCGTSDCSHPYGSCS